MHKTLAPFCVLSVSFSALLESGLERFYLRLYVKVNFLLLLEQFSEYLTFKSLTHLELRGFCLFVRFIYVLFLCVLPVCARVWAWYAFGGQKKELDRLDLGLQMVVNHDVDAGNPTQVLCKSKLCS